MDGKKFVLTANYCGTTAGNASWCWTMQGPATILEVSACASNDSDATITLGTSTNADAYLLADTIGDTNVPKVFDRGDFDGDSGHDTAECPHIAADAVLVLALDYDGSSGTAADDFVCVITLLEG